MNTGVNDVRVTVRVDKSLKESADNLFERLGLNMTTALNVFLRKAVDENAIPFPVSVKAASFGTGYSANDVSTAFAGTVQQEVGRSKEQGLPIARYDTKTRRAYLEKADGSREYVDEK
ncbi:MAG: type II toxin-antitoxin system RelB/DinJ family antitoxin [Oscillospiraceae bacterium]|jgi:addiction module RelB/DinJ family antitoxin|nr:type II toxin-antitoxin system RelB/DinJ family antitoxin [Oscillospiraceae bacterium]